MKVNWWLVGTLEFVLLLLILAGYELFYLSSSNKLSASRIEEKSSSSDNTSDKFTLEGVKVEINHIGYDKFLSTIIGNIGDIEEITIAGFSGIFTTYGAQGEEKQQMYILKASEESDRVVVITVTNEKVTEEDIVDIIESLE